MEVLVIMRAPGGALDEHNSNPDGRLDDIGPSQSVFRLHKSSNKDDRPSLWSGSDRYDGVVHPSRPMRPARREPSLSPIVSE